MTAVGYMRWLGVAPFVSCGYRDEIHEMRPGGPLELRVQGPPTHRRLIRFSAIAQTEFYPTWARPAASSAC